jgi:hypothetical protein
MDKKIKQYIDSHEWEPARVVIEKRWTVADIAAANERAGGRYFSRENLKASGQTRGSFTVYHYAGRVFVFAPGYWHGRPSGKTGPVGWSIAEFLPDTGRTRSVPGKYEARDRLKSPDDVRAFIKEAVAAGVPENV